MKCEHILGITVVGTVAIEASHVALEKKYQAHSGFIGLRRSWFDLESLLEDASAFAHMIGKQHVGVHWELHTNQFATEPVIATFTKLTAGLFNLGIGICEINLNGLARGVSQDDSRGAPVDLNASMVAEFCRLLTKQVAHKLLHGCMVNGYRSSIILYNSQSPFCIDQPRTVQRPKKVGTAVQNSN